MRKMFLVLNQDAARQVAVVTVALALSISCDSEGDASDSGNPTTTNDHEEAGGEASSGSSTAVGDSTGGLGSNSADEAGTDGGTTGSSGDDAPPVYFDLGSVVDTPDNKGACGAPPAVECDDDPDADPWQAMGLNCPGGPDVDGTLGGDPMGFYIHEGPLGTFQPPAFPPREGEKILMIASGVASNITMPGFFMSTDIVGFVDNDGDLPLPILTNSVDVMDDCAVDPSLVGTGDCSNTIQEQWDQGSGANDYVELRFTTNVPANTTGFSYDLAFMSTEYPDYYHSQFNDMYIAWLESEDWTGNISFDEMGHPISLNAGFLDFKDAPNPIDCPLPCNAPELAGTAMQGHAATKWLTTTAGVTPNEEITVVFAIFDVSDPNLDSIVLLDNFQWGCEGGPPATIPG